MEVKQEIEKHLAEKEILENSIPSMIVIGPFQINTETVRQKLASKRKALANQVIELLAKKLRKQNDEVRALMHFYLILRYVDEISFVLFSRCKNNEKFFVSSVC